MMTCKILMMVPVWRRPEIVELFINNVRRVECTYAKVIPYFVLSAEDPEIKRNEELTDGFNVNYQGNKPLGQKKNNALREALSLRWDYYMDMGSDDIYTPLLWTLLENCFVRGVAYFGLRNLHVYNWHTHQAKYVPEYHLNMLDKVAPIGPGRCIRRDVVEQLLPLWPSMNSGMDGHSDLKIQTAGHEPVIIDNTGPVLCDVKTDCHISPWEFFDDMGEEVDPDEVVEAFSLPDPSTRFRRMPFDDFHSKVLKESRKVGRREAFDRENQEHRSRTGCDRYSSYESYLVMVSRNYKKK